MKKAQAVINADIAQMCERYAKLKSISCDAALKIIMGSQTYKILINVETGLCYEMTDYVYDMFLEEMGDLSEL